MTERLYNMEGSRWVMALAWTLLVVVGTVLGQLPNNNIPIGNLFSEKTLRLAIEVCRHGDRSTLYTFPKDKLPFAQWPQGRGQLTPVGMKAHYDLGARLREKFVDTSFLDASYNMSQIYVRSTDMDRTLMSAMSQMAGLYPYETASTYDVGEEFGMEPYAAEDVGLPYRWQIIPIHTVELGTDTWLSPGVKCPRHDYLLSQLSSTKEWQQKNADAKQVCSTVKKVTGLDSCDLHTIVQVNDVFVCDESHGIPVDHRVSKSDRKQIKDFADWATVAINSGEKIQKMRGGPLMYEIGQRISIAARKVEPSKAQPELPSVKFILLSAHDSTLSALLAAMQVYDGINPPYNSTVFFELHELRDLHFVKVEYNGKPLKLPGCKDPYCEYDNFMASMAMRAVDPVHHARMCQNVLLQSKSNFAFGCFIGFLLALLGGFSYMYFSSSQAIQLPKWMKGRERGAGSAENERTELFNDDRETG